jgi:tetratricopeptide (TPR) repeat protein
MKLSENSNYQKYMQSLGHDDLLAAVEHLKACLDDLGGDEYEASYRAFILQEIGNLMLLRGARAEANHYHREALRTDPSSLLTKLQFAKFLAKSGDLVTAITQCDEIVRLAESSPFSESEDDFNSEYYSLHAKELKEECLARGENRGQS